MRWQFVDCVTAFEPWQQIAGRKAVSLEEYYLLQPLGREGVLPESLVIECCAQLAHWLVAASSSFATTALLSEVEHFAFDRRAEMGHLLDVEVHVAVLREHGLTVDCQTMSEGAATASGRLTLALTGLAELLDTDELRGLWRELRGQG